MSKKRKIGFAANSLLKAALLTSGVEPIYCPTLFINLVDEIFFVYGTSINFPSQFFNSFITFSLTFD